MLRQGANRGAIRFTVKPQQLCDLFEGEARRFCCTHEAETANVSWSITPDRTTASRTHALVRYGEQAKSLVVADCLDPHAARLS